jgi:predicted dienelactone hydrolase
MASATPTPLPAFSPLDLATTFCSNIHFHQSLHIPASPEHERLRVTYATTTNFGQKELPVVLFCHPMGAARHLIYKFEEVAKKEGVRVLIVDRYVWPFSNSSTNIFFGSERQEQWESNWKTR